MGKEIFRPVAKTLIVLVAIGMFSCKSPMRENIQGANMGEKHPVVVEIKKDAHQEEVLKAIPQQVKEEPPKKILKIKMVGPGPEPDSKIKTDPLPYKGSR